MQRTRSSAVGKRHGVRFSTTATLVNQLEEAQKQYQLDCFLKQRDKVDLLVCDELGYLSFSQTGAELLFQVFADRYERASLLITSNLPFSEWQQVFQGVPFQAVRQQRLPSVFHRCDPPPGNHYRKSADILQPRASRLQGGAPIVPRHLQAQPAYSEGRGIAPQVAAGRIAVWPSRTPCTESA